MLDLHACVLYLLREERRRNVCLLLFSHSVISDSLWPDGLCHARLPCPSLSLRVCWNWYPTDCLLRTYYKSWKCDWTNITLPGVQSSGEETPVFYTQQPALSSRYLCIPAILEARCHPCQVCDCIKALVIIYPRKTLAMVLSSSLFCLSSSLTL